VITWENPATTVFIEMKYGSPLSSKTANNNGSAGFPADQLVRNARIGLYENGWIEEDRLFHAPPRDFVLILLTPSTAIRWCKPTVILIVSKRQFPTAND
jgi:hypothetical protein